MKVLKVVYNEDVAVTSHEYDEHHTWAVSQDVLRISDVAGDPVASYNWPCVIYVRFEDKLEA